MPTETLTTTPDPALFLDFLDPNLSLLDLADRHALALDDLLDWSEHPETHQRLARLHTLLTFRNSFLAAERLPIALTSLTAAATQTAPPDADPALAHRTTESARRAATQLARLGSVAQASRLCQSRDLPRATDHPALRTVGAPATPIPDQFPAPDAPSPPPEVASPTSVVEPPAAQVQDSALPAFSPVPSDAHTEHTAPLRPTPPPTLPPNRRTNSHRPLNPSLSIASQTPSPLAPSPLPPPLPAPQPTTLGPDDSAEITGARK